MATYTQSQIENVWFALNLNRLVPNNDQSSGAGLHNPNRSINMYKWLEDAIALLGMCKYGVNRFSVNGESSVDFTTCGGILNFVGAGGVTLTADDLTKTITITGSGGGGGGTDTTIYSTNGTLTSNRQLQLSDYFLFISMPPVPNQSIVETSWFPSTEVIETSATNFTLGGGNGYSVTNQLQNFDATYKANAHLGSRVINGAFINDSAITVNATNSVVDGKSTEIEFKNQMLGSLEKLSLLFKAEDGDVIGKAFLELPTNWTSGLNTDSKLYMTPSCTDESTNEIRYTYPLQRNIMTFGTADTTAVVGDFGSGVIATGSTGTKRKAVNVLISARAFSNTTGDITINVIRASDASVWYTKTITMSGVANTYGTLSKEVISLVLSNDDYYYAQVSAASGDGTSIRGLQITIDTI